MEWEKLTKINSDMGFIISEGKKLGIRTQYKIIDTIEMTKILLPQLNRHTLSAVAETLHVSLENHQKAVDYAGCVAEIFVKLTGCLCGYGICRKKQPAEQRRSLSIPVIRPHRQNPVCLCKT